MGAEAGEMNKQPVAAGVAPVANGKVSDDVEKKMPVGSEAASKPVGGRKVHNGALPGDDIASTLAAASEKLQAGHKIDQKKPSKGVGRFFRALYPKNLFIKLRDSYVNTCVMAAEKGDLADLVAGHPGMYYGDSLMSRQISQRRDREHHEMLQASLSRQASVSLSRQFSSQNQSGQLNLPRNMSTGIPGLSRQGSTAIPGLSHQSSTGIPRVNRQTSTGITGLNRNHSAGIAGLNRNHSVGIPGLNRNLSTGIAGPNSRPFTGTGGLHRLTSVGRNTFGRSTSSKKESNLFSAGREKFLQQQGTDFSASKTGHLNLNRNIKVTSVPETEVVKSERV